eukprot:CAMPEP_0182459320 /NCGR_PEP_ID=MMETSP1319-20130603/4473_1 /TAXON_ID=172717 /ORGANISM="Bolidomonas pacifica, Strain RCC208" /LENGTH=464 /DNA_ID=CAMNT_0024658211 /DNA_START=193 /DNA_END=1587 /DNA_ORIENTATION=+
MPPPPNPDEGFHPPPYVPCEDVDYGEYCPITELHLLPRYSLVSFSEVSGEFPTEFDPLPEEYMGGVAFYPSLILCMAFILSLVSFFYACCCAKCSGRGKDEKVDKVTKRTPLVVLLIFLVLFAGSSIVGGKSVTEGLELAVDDFADLTGEFDKLAQHGIDMNGATADLQTYFDEYAATCQAASSYSSEITEYTSAITEFTAEAEDFPELLDEANENFKEYYIYGAFALALPLVLVAANVFLTTFGCSASFRKAMCTCRCLLYISNFLGIFTMLLLGFFAAWELGFGIFFSDFCIDPNHNMVNMAEAFGTGFQVNATEYYILCEGENPMGDLLLDADSALQDFKSGLEQTITVAGCTQTAAYDNLIGSIDTSKNLVESVIVDASCKNLNPYMQNLVYNSFCERFVPGVAAMSFSMLLTMVFLLPVVITSRQFAERIAEDDNGDQMELVGVGGRKSEAEANYAQAY